MRLTLRTMLAYLDDVLEGPDVQELGQKIDESKFAGDLVQRIRSSVRRLRLGAPQVDGKGLGAEANTVAEYLDNTMPKELVPDFEKVCLESDVQLAEVAACHQILTLVLGEPASVDGAVRERMYRAGYSAAVVSRDAGVLQDAGDSAGNGEWSAAPAPVAEVAAAASETRRPSGKPPGVEVDSRRVRPAAANSPSDGIDSRFPFKSIAVSLLLGFVVAAVALRAIHPFDTEHPLWRWMAGNDHAKVIGQASTAASTPAASLPEDGTGGLPVVPPAGPAASSPVAAPEQTVPGNLPSNVPGDQPREPDAVAASAAPDPSKVPSVDAAVPGSTESAVGQPDASTAKTDSSAIPIPGTVSPVSKPDVEPVRPASPADRPADRPDAPATVARYISEEQILARLDSTKNAWMTLPADSSLAAGEQVLSLPTYRPQILIAPGTKMTLAGEAFLKLHAPESANVSRVTLEFGRAVLVPVGEIGNAIQLEFAGRSGQLLFADQESVVAMEVRPYLPPGADPSAAAAELVVQFWVTSGSAEWRETGRDSVLLQAGQRGHFIGNAAVAIVNQVASPDWENGKNLSDIDRRASQELRKFLTADRPLALSLLEHTKYRQVEVRALSCRCLCYLDIFEPGLIALADHQNRSYWNAQVAAIQSILPFGSDTVERLRADIDRLHGPEGEKIYRLLRGYSPEQLTAGGATELVEALESKSMPIRVLAFLTLLHITEKSHQFRPENRPDQERSKLMKWKKMLEGGQIVYKSPPIPLPPVVAAASEDSTK